jgi:hypothetical protein
MTAVTTTVVAGWRDLVHLQIEGWGFTVHVGLILLIVVAVLVAVALARHRPGGWEVTSANFTFAGCAAVTVCPTDLVAGLAHQAWVEVATRKAAIPFDEQNDVIVEVYNSWYELFRAFRELAKSVPTRRGLREGSDTAKLLDALTGALNVGLRPHLTRWQALFRRWYDNEQRKPEAAGLSPQEIQRRFPQYAELIADLKEVNAGLREFADALRVLAHERRLIPWWKFWASVAGASPSDEE